jgi:hypothetical protein
MNEAGAQQRSIEKPGAPSVRFEATVHPGQRQVSLEGVADLDLDRVPDPEGGVRVLITADDAVALLNRGYEVHLLTVLPVTPLDASLVADEGAALGWLEEQVKGIQRHQAT